MESIDDRNAAMALKVLLCLFLAGIAVFFVVQATLGARGTASAPGERTNVTGTTLGERLFGSFEGLIEDLASARTYPLVPIWELAVGGEVFIDKEGDFLYLTSTTGRVMSIKAATGDILWSLDLGVWVSAPPTARDGVVYVGATNHMLYALDAGSGALLWYYATQGEILAQPVVGGGMVFVTADNDSVYDLMHRLYALDARSGKLLWMYDTESWTPSPPALGEHAVYLGGYRREVYALDKLTGRELWSFKASSIVFSSPQIVAGKLLFTCIDGWVHALEAEKGTPLWSRKLPGFVWLSPPDGSGIIYACSHRDTLNAMSLETGEELWAFDDGDLLSSSALPESGAVCAFVAQGNAYVLDAATGKPLGRLLAPHGFVAPPLVAGRYVYAGSLDGFVRAYTLPADGVP